ncbi:fam-a protein [Plasmodium chabaudi chabaudi]|uniref:Fam-a protein n=1 Tax=Plasmodium chabaudi chabaudi TaxID=31271 RepID=A0A077TR08_PLACU|nr:fam-a protein [Plasmodium chabaudi chabaudi]SCM08161.1 fam-a protein [Plasmodium chabaudi chabaudi]VTZ70266.1 fam-a protein [Plasmodium chabaudi chabaudi]|eukprot:XP_016654571.1 fam-a protein [Plasmodium chabaudi chabaudi]
MNKIYIKIALTLLCVAGYMQNIAFASERAPKTKSSNEDTKYESYFYPEEAKQAGAVMDDAFAIAQKYAKSTKGYKLHYKNDGATLHLKRDKGAYIGKVEFKIKNPDSFDGIINMIMDSNGPKNLYDLFIGGHVSRMYDDSLVIIQQNYRSRVPDWQRHFQVIANIVESSENKVAILFVSPNTNGYNSRTHKKHVNPIVESANSFTPDVRFQTDFMNPRVSEIYVNLAAFFIKKKPKYVKVTFIGSVDLNFPRCVSDKSIEKMTAGIFSAIFKLKNIFKKE